MSRLPSFLLTGLLLGSCAAPALRPGISTVEELHRSLGEPALEFREPDGSRRLAYPSGPFGTQTFMADVGPDGRVRSVSPVLADDNFHRIQPGQTRDEVLRRIGPPGDTMSFPRLGHDAWDYRFVDTWGYTAIFSVTFDRDGVVVGKITRRLERPRLGL